MNTGKADIKELKTTSHTKVQKPLFIKSRKNEVPLLQFLLPFNLLPPCHTGIWSFALVHLFLSRPSIMGFVYGGKETSPSLASQFLTSTLWPASSNLKARAGPALDTSHSPYPGSRGDPVTFITHGIQLMEFPFLKHLTPELLQRRLEPYGHRYTFYGKAVCTLHELSCLWYIHCALLGSNCKTSHSWSLWRLPG